MPFDFILDSEALFTGIGIIIASIIIWFVKKGALNELINPQKNKKESSLEDRIYDQIEQVNNKNKELADKLGKHLDDSKFDHLVLTFMYKNSHPDDPLNILGKQGSPF